MPRRFITYIIFFTFLKLIGCYSYQEVTYQEFESTNPNDINSEDIYIITRDSTKYHSNWWTFSVYEDSVYIKGSKYYGNGQTAFKGKIAVSDIETIEVDKYDETATTISILVSITAGVLAIIYLGSQVAGGCSDNINSSLN